MRPEPTTLVAALLLTGCTCDGRLPGRKAVRPPEQAGVFYPADPDALRKQLDALFADVTPYEGPVQAVLVPHAGLDWCGRISARTFGALKGRHFRRIVILTEHHDARWRGAALPAEGALATPIGQSRIDEAAVGLLEGYPGFARRAAAFDGEYGVEVLLPYVQHLWPETPIVPVFLGVGSREEQLEVARALRNVLDEGTLLVLSATFTHFAGGGYEPPIALDGTKADIHARLREFEQPILDAVLARDPARFDEAVNATNARSCGYNGLYVGLTALGAGDAGVELARGTSLDVVFDPAALSGVSYLGLLFPGRFPPVATLDPDDRLALARIAEENVAAAVHRSEPPPLGELSPRLRGPGGAFVTVTQHGLLRGCMGRLLADSLAAAVAHAARMAVSDDPRFRPLRPDDLPRIELEISVLGPFVPIASPDDFEPGRHGLLLTHGHQRGLLLPQVATKYGMDREAFLEALAEKAGLAPDSWRRARLERFGVECFEPGAAIAAAS